MKEENKKSASMIFSARMSSLNVAMLYSFMLKRIAKGYSTSEISFLMGYTTDFIKQKEELKSIGFSFEDIHCFKQAMEEQSLRAFAPGYENQNYTADYLLIKQVEGPGIHIKMLRIAEDQSETLMFQLLEENPAYARHQTINQENAALARAIMKVLFEGRLFYTPQMPLTIYQRCRSAVGSENIDPKHVQAALSELSNKKDFPRLKRIRSKEYGCMYEKVFE
ncbi:hypothetical protein [Pedobacter steynii]|uniref:Uncharacterized protein n=1 Tax=Pedobacter steynii TaxID=430522 RepID=A0A1D7QEX4_9SPHI|nr:hypothetical protein [Pedobacter steynii]AOM77256.1 hypothetical protein BFS30_08835 [Pedobacter steynii]